MLTKKKFGEYVSKHKLKQYYGVENTRIPFRELNDLVIAIEKMQKTLKEIETEAYVNQIPTIAKWAKSALLPEEGE